MAQMEHEPAASPRACQGEVDRLALRFGWALLDLAEWARRASRELAAGRGDSLNRVAVHVYSQAMHAACSGAEGRPRQNSGYAELFRYLFDIARRRYPEMAEDAAQRAVEYTFERFGRCRVPGAFLAFAAQQLLAAARDLRAQERAHDHAINTPPSPANQRQGDLEAAVVTNELRERFDQAAQAFLSKHPRATRQFEALRLKYIDELDDETIGRRLGTSVGNIYVLRSRAIDKLREEPVWRALAVEFGILPED
jgi:RNA polymerase sigma factor (sigma-70 family)